MRSPYLLLLMSFLLLSFDFTGDMKRNAVIKKEIISSYRFDSDRVMYLSDSTIRYYNRNEMVLEIQEPAFESSSVKKYRTDATYYLYTTAGQIKTVYTNYIYPNDTYPKVTFNDSLEYTYQSGRLVAIEKYHAGNRELRKTTFHYNEDGLRLKRFQSYKSNLDSAIYTYYPASDTVSIESFYTKGERCYNIVTTAQKNDTLTQYWFNSSSIECGFNSFRSTRKIYNEGGQLMKEELLLSGKTGDYHYNEKGLLARVCKKNTDECFKEVSYTYDKHGNWIQSLEISNGAPLILKKRALEYFKK